MLLNHLHTCCSTLEDKTHRNEKPPRNMLPNFVKSHKDTDAFKALHQNQHAGLGNLMQLKKNEDEEHIDQAQIVLTR